MFSLQDYVYEGIEGTIASNAILYRCTSAAWCSHELLANGQGPVHGNTSGRFHFAQQPTTYCANNVLTSVSEVVYHMYRKALEAVRFGHSVQHIEATAERHFCLVIFRVAGIGELTRLDCEDFQREHGPKLSGTMVVHPDDKYVEFQTVGTKLREDKRRGVVYPSARHSRGDCYALFRDETKNVLFDSVKPIPLTLRLVSEDQDRNVVPGRCSPHKHKLDPVQAFYQFDDLDKFQNANDGGLLNPAKLPRCGYFDFTRRMYSSYPEKAITVPQS